jgi:hypothetical protein
MLGLNNIETVSTTTSNSVPDYNVPTSQISTTDSPTSYIGAVLSLFSFGLFSGFDAPPLVYVIISSVNWLMIIIFAVAMFIIIRGGN